MDNKVIDFVSYRRMKLTEITLELTDNHIGTLVVAIADEISSINKQLSTIKHLKTTIAKKEYSYFYNAKESLLNFIEKINKYFSQNEPLTVNFNLLDCAVGSIESQLQNLTFLDRENTSEYRNLCYVYKALLPIYDKNKVIWENLKANEEIF